MGKILINNEIELYTKCTNITKTRAKSYARTHMLKNPASVEEVLSEREIEALYTLTLMLEQTRKLEQIMDVLLESQLYNCNIVEDGDKNDDNTLGYE